MRHSEENVEDGSTAGRALPPPSLKQSMRAADLVVIGEVDELTPDGCWVRIASVVKGEADSTRVRVSSAIPLNVGDSGGFVLRGPSPYSTMTGERPHDLTRRILRVDAGLPELEEPYKRDQLAALCATADVVALVRFLGVSGTQARVDAIEVHKGTLPDQQLVTRGDVDEGEPGGAWEFGEGSDGFATVFLRQVSDGWTVLNDRDPRLCRLDQVDRACAHATRRPPASASEGLSV